MEKWYLLRGVEYSTNFDFFLEHQIYVGSKTKMNVDWNLTEYTKKGYEVEENKTFSREMGKKVVSSRTVNVRNVLSRLESFNFGEVIGSISKETEQLRVIHTKLLSGGFGEGKLID